MSAQTTQIKFLQINIGRSVAAHDLMMAVAKREGMDVLILSEPNLRKVRTDTRWYTDTRGDAAILIHNKNLNVSQVTREEGMVGVQTEERLFCSCYISPNCPLQEFEAFVERLELFTAGKKGAKVLIGGDFNAKAEMWGSAYTNSRGRLMAEWILGNELVLLNDGRLPTFQRNNQE